MSDIEDMREFNGRVAKSNKSSAINKIDYPISTSPPDVQRASGKSEFSSLISLWAESGDAYFPCESTVPTLPAAHYIINLDPHRGLHFLKTELIVDNLLELPDSSSADIIQSIEKFWTLEDHYLKHGFLWKRGFMIWGCAGGGKTSALQILIKKIIDAGGIAVSICNPELAIIAFRILRKIEPKRPIIAILEDIDSIVQRHGDSALLSLLDGETQISNIVYIATTNYPERLDPRLINRPSRFDVIKKIGMPSPAARELFLTAKSKTLANNRGLLDRWIKDTDGLPIAHIKELIISVEVFGLDYETSLTRLKAMMDCEAHSRDFDMPSIGFIKESR